ncbi:DUF892 family protein [Flavobacterium sp. LB3P45]|uniref:DUF892 family protein n=1 Tax=Flavobacterium fructosi TaxID=3230416 RepID=A0ABW6HR38_9FLAO
MSDSPASFYSSFVTVFLVFVNAEHFWFCSKRKHGICQSLVASSFSYCLRAFPVRPNAIAQSVAQLQGILKEAHGLIKETDIDVVRDAGIIAAEQKVRHYEIATDGTLHAFTKTLGENK